MVTFSCFCDKPRCCFLDAPQYQQTITGAMHDTANPCHERILHWCFLTSTINERIVLLVQRTTDLWYIFLDWLNYIYHATRTSTELGRERVSLRIGWHALCIVGFHAIVYSWTYPPHSIGYRVSPSNILRQCLPHVNDIEFFYGRLFVSCFPRWAYLESNL